MPRDAIRGTTVRTLKYQVIEAGDSLNLGIYDVERGGSPALQTIQFKTREDYGRFMIKLEEAQQNSDHLQGDIVVERLLEKTKVEWSEMD